MEYFVALDQTQYTVDGQQLILAKPFLIIGKLLCWLARKCVLE
jgi:hypothetical protein